MAFPVKLLLSWINGFPTSGYTGYIDPYWQCSGSVVVTAYDFESGRLGSNPDWGLIYYKASITAQGLPEPSSLQGSSLILEQLNIKAVTGAQVD